MMMLFLSHSFSLIYISLSINIVYLNNSFSDFSVKLGSYLRQFSKDLTNNCHNVFAECQII